MRLDSQISFLAPRHDVVVASFDGPAADRRRLEERGVRLERLPSPAALAEEADRDTADASETPPGGCPCRRSLAAVYFHLRHLAGGFDAEPEEVAFTKGFLPLQLARRIISDARPDCVVVSFPEFAYLRRAVGGDPFCVYDSIEVRYTTWARRARLEPLPHWRLYWAIEARRMRAYEAYWAGRYDLAVAISPRDKRFLEGLGCATVEVFPEGGDVACEPLARALRPVALFVGNYTNIPNVDAVRWFAAEVWPEVRRRVPQAEFHVAGASIPEEIRRLDGADGVKVLGFVNDLKEAFCSSRVFVLPMRMGGGQKIKLVEAMSAGMPVVSTPAGCEGMEVRRGRDVLVESAPKRFASAVARVLTDDAVAEALGRAAHERAARDYDRGRILERFERRLVSGVHMKDGR